MLELHAKHQRAEETQCSVSQTADFGPRTALKIVDAIRDDIRAGRVKTRADVRQANPSPLHILSTA